MACKTKSAPIRCYAKSNPSKYTLKFGLGNAKLSNSITTFSLPAGHSCPFAKECYSKANRLTGKIIDGKHCKFRCFAASQECVFSSVRNNRWFNFDLLKKCKTLQEMADLIHFSLPIDIGIVRVHVGGDFYSEKYFLAWLNVAINNPTTIFYGYTKALPFLVKYKKYIPSNFRFTASKGGTCDNLISKHKLTYAEVVFSPEEANYKNLEIDHNDSHAIMHKESFALLLHGIQPANTLAANALRQLKSRGFTGYSEEKKKSQPKSKIKILVNLMNYSPRVGVSP